MAGQEKPETAKRHQVFLTFASADKEIAQKIVDELRERNIHVWFDAYELQPGDSIAQALEKTISASDYLVVLLSPNSVNSEWMQKELGNTLFRDLIIRDITLLPVIIADCEIPKFLASYQYLDLRPDIEHNVKHLVEQISIVPEIDFSELVGISFEALIEDLLNKLGFENIEKPLLGAGEFDLKAEYSYSDPFGKKIIETWVVEIKLYRQARASLESIRQLAHLLSKIPTPSKGLLITNSHLTSVARNWLTSSEMKNRLEIRVIEGTELKRLLLQHQDLIEKYFGKKQTAVR